MPANLPPEFYQKERELKFARTPEEKIAILRELLSLMPKHKGTDKLQAEIRAKISKLSRMKGKKASPHKTTSPYDIRKEGAGQVVLIGPPNGGKSLILSSLTRANSPSPSYPFSTRFPVIGMMEYEDIKFQLIDTPSLDKSFLDRGLLHLLRICDLVLLVVDTGEEEVIEKLETTREILEKEGLELGKDGKKTLIVANKMDREKAKERFAILEELYISEFSLIPVSALRKEWDNLGKSIFDNLEIIRIYLKPPGKPPSRESPVILRKGSTVIEAGEIIHKDFLNMRYARLWNEEIKGLRVEKDYILQDGDILEFHL